MSPYLVLLRMGFTLPYLLPGHAVRSYRTISPLPATNKSDWRYIFCGTFRRLTPPRRYLAPCPVEPGLSSVTKVTAAVRPASVVIIDYLCVDVTLGLSVFLTLDTK